MLDMLALLNTVNQNVEGMHVPYDTFHMTDLSEYLDVRVDFVYWLMDQDVRKLNINYILCCNFIFRQENCIFATIHSYLMPKLNYNC